MPLTSKGKKILRSLQEEYGAEKGERVLYAGKNAGTFTGIDTAELDDAVVDGAKAWLDASEWERQRAERDKPTGSDVNKYNAVAVQKAIERSNPKIGPKEAKLIHALLRGRGDDAMAAMCDSVERMKADCRLDAAYEEWDPKTKKWRKIARARELGYPMMTHEQEQREREEARRKFNEPGNLARVRVASDPNVKDKVFNEQGRLVFGAGRRWDAALHDSISRMREDCRMDDAESRADSEADDIIEKLEQLRMAGKPLDPKLLARLGELRNKGKSEKTSTSGGLPGAEVVSTYKNRRRMDEAISDMRRDCRMDDRRVVGGVGARFDAGK